MTARGYRGSARDPQPPPGRPLQRWRTGRHNPRCIYQQTGDQPAHADDLSPDRMIGTMDTADLARLVVAAVNGYIGQPG